MKKLRDSLFYIGMIGGFSVFTYLVMHSGEKMEQGRNIAASGPEKSYWLTFLNALTLNLGHPLALLLAQVIIILLFARLFGWICKKIGQPTVIGEIAAGIILGPSLVGLYFPGVTAAFFPDRSLDNLQLLSQIGLIFFMFVIGMELDLKVLKNRARDAVIISHASIIIPFALGMALACFIYRSFAPEGIRFTSFALFLGIATSITAFPVLARIVQERGIHKTRLGTIVITCGAADDITGWCVLAVVIAIVKAGSFVSALYTVLLALIYIFLMMKVIRPFLKRIGELHTSRENLSKPIVGIFFLILILSSYTTEVIGIHALFGAFIAGSVMPENVKFRSLFIEKVEDIALVLLLPLFFVFTGLRTEINLLNDAYLWEITGLIILIATTGKFLGSTLAAKFVGQSWKDSLTIGTLMNTRGLMELIVLNIGYDLGVLKPEIFTMMVIMALVTTFMAGPALDLINWTFRHRKEEIPQEISQLSKYKILISFGNPERSVSLLRLANGLTRKLGNNATITAMHLSPVNELHHYNIEEYEKESFAPINAESRTLSREVTTLFKASGDIDSDITETANKGDFDLLLIGVGQSIFEGSLLGKILGFTTRMINPDRLLSQVTGKESIFEHSPFDERTRSILAKSHVPVGVLIDKGLERMEHIFIPVFSGKDLFLIKYAQKLINNSASQVTILDAASGIKNFPEAKETVRAIEQIAPNHVSLLNDRVIDKDFLRQQQLMLISMDSWKKIVDTKSLWLSDIPSTLILAEK